MLLEQPDLNLLAGAEEVRVAAHWLSQRRRWSSVQVARGWKLTSVLPLLRSRWGRQGAERALELTVSPAFVINSRRRTRVFQLLGHPLEVRWIADSWAVEGSRLSATWEESQQRDLNRLLKAVAGTFATEMLGAWLKDSVVHQVARLPSPYSMPAPFARWLARSSLRMSRSGWDEEQIETWAGRMR